MTDADGYFSPRNHPQEMVADPSLPQKVLDEEEAAALAAAMAASVDGANNTAGSASGTNRRVAIGVDEFVGESGGVGGIDGVVGEGIGGDSPPRYTFAPDEAEMVADGFRGGMRMGGMGMGGMGMGGVGMGGMGMGGMGMGGMGMGGYGGVGGMGGMNTGIELGMMNVGGMGHVPMGMPMPVPIPEVMPMLQAPQALQAPQIPQIPQVPPVPQPPPPPASPQPLPFMQPLLAPQSMSDRSPEDQESEESACPDCGDSQENDDSECGCRRRRDWGCRRLRRGRGGRGSRYKKKIKRNVKGIVWGVVLFMVVWGVWTMYTVFTHRGPPGRPWSHKDDFPDDKSHCKIAPYTYMGQNVFRFPIGGENASDTAESFYLHQRPLDPLHSWRRTGAPKFAGEVFITGYTPEKPEDDGMIKVQFDISMSREWMDESMKLERGKDGRGVTIYTDYKLKMADPHEDSHACANIGITVSIPHRTTSSTEKNAKMISTVLKNMDIDLQSLCITIDHSNLDLVVDGETNLNSFCGDITFRSNDEPSDLGERSQFPWPSPPRNKVENFHQFTPPASTSVASGLRSKSLKAKTLTGRIFAMPMLAAPGSIQVENAHLETTSGHIHAAIIPHLASNTNAYPANLTIKTITGDVLLDKLPGHDSQDFNKLRRTQTYIRTTSGRIFGETLLTEGSLLDIRSFSGNIDRFHVSVPAGIQANPPVFKTQTKTGTTRVKVVPAGVGRKEGPGEDDDDDNEPQGPLIVRGFHTSVSGLIQAVYHPSWGGKFVGKSFSEDIYISGKGLKKIPYNKDFENSTFSSSSSSSSSILGEDIPTPDPATWHIVHARKGSQKEPTGMVEIQTFSGASSFMVEDQKEWRDLLMAAKKAAKELLIKVGCSWLKEGRRANTKMVDVGVQTEDVQNDDIEFADVKLTDEDSLDSKGSEGDDESEQMEGMTLVETEKDMGKPTEIEDDGGDDDEKEKGKKKGGERRAEGKSSAAIRRRRKRSKMSSKMLRRRGSDL